MPRFESKPDLSPTEVFRFIRFMGAASTKEIKEHFGTDSASVRRAIGQLMFHNRVFVVSGGWKLIFWMEVDGKRGAPNPKKKRAEARHRRGDD